MSASSMAIAVSAAKPGRERPEDDAGDDVADDRGQPGRLARKPPMKAAIRPTAIVEMRTGSWSMALPVEAGGRRTGAGPCQNDDW